MGNPMVDDLVRKMRSGRISRRHFIQSASALGLSATSISSASAPTQLTPRTHPRSPSGQPTPNQT